MKLLQLSLLLVLPALSYADIEMRFNDGSVGLVSGGRVLFGDDENSVLFQPGEDGMIVLSRSERTWMRLEPGFVEEMAAQMQAQMDAMLADMPPEQRAMVEEQMQGMVPQMTEALPEMSIRRTGRSDTVAGFDCDEAEVLHEDGAIEEIVCVASPAELGIDAADFDSLVSAMRGMAEMASIDPDAAPQADFEELGGIPIRSRDPEHGNDSELVSLATGRVDPARLRIPDDYREISLEQMFSR